MQKNSRMSLRDELLKQIKEEKPKYKVAKDVAIKEVKSWFESNNIDKEKQEQNIDHFEALVVAVMKGDLVLEGSVWVQKLNDVIESEEKTTKLKYSKRIRIGRLRKMTQNMASDDDLGKSIAMVALVTNKPTKLIENLSVRDLSISTAIMVFF